MELKKRNVSSSIRQDTGMKGPLGRHGFLLLYDDSAYQHETAQHDHCRTIRPRAGKGRGMEVLRKLGHM